jgi:hypothetical protein
MMTILVTIAGTYLFIGLAVGILIILKELKSILEYETNHFRIAINIIGIIVFWLPIVIKEMFTD